MYGVYTVHLVVVSAYAMRVACAPAAQVLLSSSRRPSTAGSQHAARPHMIAAAAPTLLLSGCRTLRQSKNATMAIAGDAWPDTAVPAVPAVTPVEVSPFAPVSPH